MQSHFDSLKNDYKTSCLSYETIPKSNFAHTKVNIAGNMYNISNRLSLVSLNNEQQIINSDNSTTVLSAKNGFIHSIIFFVDSNMVKLDQGRLPLIGLEEFAVSYDKNKDIKTIS